MGIFIPHLLCLPEQKEFLWEHQKDGKRKEGCKFVSGFPEALGSQEQEAVYGHIQAAACMYSTHTEGDMVPGVEVRAREAEWT